MIIDVHHHYLPRAFLDRLESFLPRGHSVQREGDLLTMVRTEDGYAYPRIQVRFWSDPATQLAAMDAAGVDHAVLSPACFQDWMTLEAARIINDGTAELVRAWPQRFSGMISVPPDGGEAMVREMRRAKDELGLCALNMTTTHRGRYPDHDDFRLFFATAAQLDLPVYVHPSWLGPALAHLNQWNLERTLGKPADLVLGAARMLYSGAFAAHPRLRMLFAHLGGTLPMMRQRLFFGQPGFLATPQTDYAALLERVFVDTAPAIWQSSDEIEYAAAKLGAAQVLLGSDYPLSNDPASVLKLAVDHVRGARLKPHARDQILGGNARRLFGLERIAPPLPKATGDVSARPGGGDSVRIAPRCRVHRCGCGD